MINKVLIVGQGSIGKRHLRLMRELLQSAEIMVLRHSKTGEIPEFADGYFHTLEEAIIFAPDIAVIANPATLHIETARALAEIGAHMLIEKPISSSIDGVQNIIDHCEKNGTILMTGYNLRFLESLNYFREQLNSNIIGDLLSVRCEVGQFLPSWRPNQDYRNTVSAKSKLGGGVLLELSHEIDYIRWIFGEIHWVLAKLLKQSELEIDVEDTAHLLLGILGKGIKPSFVATLDLDFLRHDRTRLCTAIGERGSLRWDGILGEVSIFRPGGESWEILLSEDLNRDDTFLRQLNHFIECIEFGNKPRVSGVEGLEVMKIIEAARISNSLDNKVFVVHESKKMELS
jgi:predicted dehydrogenase